MYREAKTAIHLAFKEDRSDLTSLLLFKKSDRSKAYIVAKEEGVLCGVHFAAMVFRALDRRSKIKILKRDGSSLRPGDRIMIIEGRTIDLLASERKAVNFLQHLSGVATLTSKYVHAVRGTPSKIFDTRKTIPGLRLLQKYAVRCGGGNNHRMNLSQMALVKDNHLKAVQSAKSKVRSLKAKLPKNVLLEIEAKTINEIRLALEAKADIIMLDNMPIKKLKKAINLIRTSHLAPRTSHPEIEVSGGITLKSVRQIAKLGVERISIGALTHSAPALDISLEIEK